MPNPDEALRRRLEADLTGLRVAELKLRPVEGSFDAAHLREINRRIFQDLPSVGFTEVTPGQFRPPVEFGKDHQKCRALEVMPGNFFVAYSKMDDAAQRRLETALRKVDVEKIGMLDRNGFASTIGQLYAELDYIHPFPDGNSRTLRSFTAQLAEKVGYSIEWDRIAETAQGRDSLYIARDLSVNRLAKPGIEHPNTMMRIVASLNRLGGNRELHEVVSDVLRPSRSVAFERLEREAALRRHPELAAAFAVLDASAEYITKASVRPDAKEGLMRTISAGLIQQMDRGEVIRYDAREVTRSQSISMSTPIAQHMIDKQKGMDR